jgi:hypothetical protein
MGSFWVLCTERVFLFRKYQFMEANNQRRVAGLKDKIPDIQKTVETVRFLQQRKVCWFRCSEGGRVGCQEC